MTGKAGIRGMESADRAEKDKAGKVWLVGAGCGGPELITVKGLSLVESCDVLLYDSLSARELLERARPDCERIDVGKRYGGRAASQEEINGLLIRKAREGKTVVRLKGGDPYVFGRGGEEMLALREAGIACEEVPGISSAIAAPAAAGIPVTHRGLSRSVTVLTASSLTEGEERLTEADYGALARLSGTLVVLMGMHHLKELTDRLIGAGMPPSRPAAVVMEGATDRQKWVRAPLERLAEEAERAGLKAPAVIVIGETAALHLAPMDFSESNDWPLGPSPQGIVPHGTSPQRISTQRTFPQGKLPRGTAEQQVFGPLSGVRVGVTGTEGFAARLAAALGKQGAETVKLSFLETVPTERPLPELSGFSWLVFTSPNGVRIFLEKMKQERRDLRTLAGKRIAVIGPGTGETLAESGLIFDLMPEIHDASHLGAALAERMGPGERALLLRSELGSPALTQKLSGAGREYEDFALYELREKPGQREKVFRRLRENPPDYLLFGSASGVRSFVDGLIQSVDKTALHNAFQCGSLPRIGCIGPQCRAAWEEEKGRLKQILTEQPEAFTAEEFNIDGLVQAVGADRRMRRSRS
ncbi:MAG TPA: uroporphyrinogen-III C-methyltransferase [Candidatus Eisenbergiella stercoravium]|nr:uroporphyrinogen-III C-methyltransferase [Candidatus Eisenbergiella stercoravium]